MKKILVACSLLAFTASKSNAQGTLAKGDAQLNAGIGLSSWGLPIYVGADFGVAKNITVGVEGSFRSYNTVGYDFTVISVGANGNYHFNEALKLDPEWDFYAGLNAGYYIYNTPSGYFGGSLSTFGIAGQIGGRYFFNNKFGINAELNGGSAASGLKVGITVKL